MWAVKSAGMIVYELARPEIESLQEQVRKSAAGDLDMGEDATAMREEVRTLQRQVELANTALS